MNPPSRYRQNAVILVAIALVILALWRLHTHPKEFGGIGSFVSTNVLGPATLSLIPGSEPGAGGPGSNGGPTTSSNDLAPITTNPPTPAPAPPPPPSAPPPGSRQTLSTNLSNTNGPVTLIAVAAADLVVTPPGVTYSSNTPEAATIERRLGDASAKGGDIQFSLSWNTVDDLDLHCVDPGGDEIWFGQRISPRTHGELDVDRNAQPPFTTSPVENIYWPENGAPAGLYKIYVVFYAAHQDLGPKAATDFTVRTVVRGWKTYFFKSSIRFTGNREPKLICTLRYFPNDPDPNMRFGFVR